MESLVYIILLNYKGFKDTIECVESLEKINYKNYKIVIVDNNSPDDSYKKLKATLGHKHTLIKSEENGGFAAGNNIGIKYALDNGAEYVLLLNNDTLVEKEFLSELIKPFKKDKTIGMTTGKIYYEGKRDIFWFAGGYFREDRFYGAHIGEGEKDIGQYDEEKTISFSTGCLMLINKDVFKRCGYLPEEYFMYYEDVDFCLKLRENDFNIVYTPKSKIYHKVSASTGGEASPFAIKLNTRNRKFLIEKYKNKMKYTKYIRLKSFFYVTRVMIMVKYTMKNEKEKRKALIEGLK